MKEEIKAKANWYSKRDDRIQAYIDGAEWMQSQYNGLSPDTVREMYEALKEIDSRTDVYSPIDMTWLSNFINPIITKAEQELKK